MMTTEGEGLIMMWLKRATTTGTKINSPRILIKRCPGRQTSHSSHVVPTWSRCTTDLAKDEPDHQSYPHCF